MGGGTQWRSRRRLEDTRGLDYHFGNRHKCVTGKTADVKGRLNIIWEEEEEEEEEDLQHLSPVPDSKRRDVRHCCLLAGKKESGSLSRGKMGKVNNGITQVPIL